MSVEAFYTTAAQVLPTLLIALVLEFRYFYPKFEEMQGETSAAYLSLSGSAGVDVVSDREFRYDASWSSAERMYANIIVERRYFWGVRLNLVEIFYFVSLVGFVIGEACALLAIALGPSGWIGWIAFSLTILSLVVVLANILYFAAFAAVQANIKDDKRFCSTLVAMLHEKEKRQADDEGVSE